MKSIVAFIVIFLVFSCQRADKPQLQIININVNDTSEVNISAISENYRVVPLNTPDSILVSGISLLCKTNEYIFTADRTNGILRFDSSGNFINTIGRKGKGPGEYTSVMYFAVDSINRQVLAVTSKQVLSYDFEGNFQKSINTGVSVIESIHSFENGNFFTGTLGGIALDNGGYGKITRLYRIDEQLNITDSIELLNVRFDKNVFGMAYDMTPFSFSEEGLSFYFPFITPEQKLRDTLYNIQGKVLVPSFKLDFGVPYSYSLEMMTQNMVIMKIFRTDRYIFAQYAITDKGSLLSIYDVNEKQVLNMRNGLTEDFYNTGIINIYPLNSAQNEVYFIRDGFQLEGRIDGINENSNPVVFFVKLRV